MNSQCYFEEDIALEINPMHSLISSIISLYYNIFGYAKFCLWFYQQVKKMAINVKHCQTFWSPNLRFSVYVGSVRKSQENFITPSSVFAKVKPILDIFKPRNKLYYGEFNVAKCKSASLHITEIFFLPENFRNYL